LRRDPTSTTVYLPNMELRLDKTTGQVSGTRYYDHGGALVAVGDGTSIQFQSADPHGSAELSVDGSTQALAQRRFTPFGQFRGTPTGIWPTDKGFVGGTIDPSGLTNLGARQYDSDTGRFISVDPLFDLTDPQSWNGYAYSDNNPATKSDPDGERACVREEDSAGCRETDQTGTVRDANGRSYGPTSNKNYCDYHNCDPTVFPANGPVPKPPIVIHFTPVYTFYPKSPEQGRAIFDYMLKRCEFGSSSLAAACSGYFGPCDDAGCKMQQSFLYGEACSHFEGVCSKQSALKPYLDALAAGVAAFGFEPNLGGRGEEGTKGIGRDLIGGEEQYHIISGNRTGGGHKWPGQSGKTVFPSSWDTEKTLMPLRM
jgi:RHS repeat-associated protein